MLNLAQTTKIRSSRPEVFCKKGVLRNFTKFTGKHLCQSLFFNKVAGLALIYVVLYTSSYAQFKLCVHFILTTFIKPFAVTKRSVVKKLKNKEGKNFKTIICVGAELTLASDPRSQNFG